MKQQEEEGDTDIIQIVSLSLEILLICLCLCITGYAFYLLHKQKNRDKYSFLLSCHLS